MCKLEKILIGSLLLVVNSISFAAAPVVLRVINNTGVDMQVQVVEADHISEKDIVTLEKNPIYGGKTIEYTINRTDAPAQIGIRFQAAQGEGEVSGYYVGRWEYIETTPRFLIEAAAPNQFTYTVDTCHNVASEMPYELSCLSNDSFPSPSATITIDNVSPK